MPMSRRTVLACFGTALLLGLCFWPRWAMPACGEVIPRLPHVDKLVHLAMFATFGFLWTSSGRPAVGVLGFACGLAAFTEVGQAWSPIGRDPDVLDALADLLGGCLGVCLVTSRRPSARADGPVPAPGPLFAVRRRLRARVAPASPGRVLE
jgi:hypothetical protein